METVFLFLLGACVTGHLVRQLQGQLLRFYVASTFFYVVSPPSGEWLALQYVRTIIYVESAYVLVAIRTAIDKSQWTSGMPVDHESVYRTWQT